MDEPFPLIPVGSVTSTRASPTDDHWDAETSTITVAEDFGSASLAGLEMFSHCIVVYVCDRAEWDLSRVSRHPRGNTNWPKVGIFAQRAKDRPNRLGVTVCRILGVSGTTLSVSGLDAIDGSPVIDIKPWMHEFGPRGPVNQPEWVRELMEEYW